MTQYTLPTYLAPCFLLHNKIKMFQFSLFIMKSTKSVGWKVTAAHDLKYHVLMFIVSHYNHVPSLLAWTFWFLIYDAGSPHHDWQPQDSPLHVPQLSEESPSRWEGNPCCSQLLTPETRIFLDKIFPEAVS